MTRPFREYETWMLNMMFRELQPGMKLTFKLRREADTVELEVTVAAP